MERILSKLDEYFGKNDYAAAERHLLYWLAEKRGTSVALTLYNELMGVYRKTAQEEKAFSAVKDALQKCLRRDHVKNRIEEIRKAQDIRQEDFAKALGVSRQTISSLENGRYNPSITLAYKIAKFFDMTIEEVFIFDEEEA